MYSGASNLADGVDQAFYFIFGVAFIFIIGLTALMIYILFRYSRKRNKVASQFEGSVKLEIIWTVIPFVLVMMMFYYGWVAFAPMRIAPDNAIKIKAIGRMWEWEFDYGNGKLSKNLYLPLNEPVVLNLFSEDVNHSLFIPAFRVKEDVVPGYNNYLWFTATDTGKYDLFCTEYCGLMHYAMITKAIVMPSEEYHQWLTQLEATGNLPEHEGLALLKKNSCLACHSLDGGKLVGPSLKGLYNSPKTVLTDQGEQQVTADDKYLYESIMNPNLQIVKGYGKNLMQSYKGTISDEEAQKIIDYLKTIGN